MKNKIASAKAKLVGCLAIAQDAFERTPSWMNSPHAGFVLYVADNAEPEVALDIATVGEIDGELQDLTNLARINALRLAENPQHISSSQYAGCAGNERLGAIRVKDAPVPLIVSIAGLPGRFNEVFACVGGIWMADDEKDFQLNVVPKIMGVSQNRYYRKLNDYEGRRQLLNVAF